MTTRQKLISIHSYRFQSMLSRWRGAYDGRAFRAMWRLAAQRAAADLMLDARS